MSMKNLVGTLAAFTLALVCGMAMASCPTCPDEQSQPGNNKGVHGGTLAGPAADGASTLAGAVGDFVSGGGGTTGNAGLDVKRYSLSGAGTGAAAAPGAKQWNIWTAYSRSNIGYNFAPLTSTGNVNVYLLGADYTFASNVVLGLATAIDRTDVDLNFSGGKLKGKGVTVSPYLGVLINKNLAFDATLGYGSTDVDTVAVGVTGSTRSDRTMGTLGLTYRQAVGAWTFTGRGALLHVHDKLGAYTLSNGTFVPDGTVNLSQARITGMAAYTSGPVTPYVSLTYINDLRRPDQAPVGGVAAANDRDAWTPAIGIRFRGDSPVYGSFQYSTERGRSEVKNNQFLLSVGVRF